MRVKVDATQWQVPCSVEFVCYVILCKQRCLSQTYSPWQFCWQCLSVVWCRHTGNTGAQLKPDNRDSLSASSSMLLHVHRDCTDCCFTSTETVQTVASRPQRLYRLLLHIHRDCTDYCFTSTETVQTIASHPQRLYRLLFHIHRDCTDYCFTSTETVQTIVSHPQRLYRLLLHVHRDCTDY